MASNPPVRTINISLPEPMRAFVEAEVARGAYGSVSEFFRELLRKAERERSHERLESILLEGITPGEPADLAPEELDLLRRTVLAQSVEQLRAKLASAAEELDRGEGQPADVEAVKAEGRRRHKSRRQT
jgi:antitoxin ParD1/3/4